MLDLDKLVLGPAMAAFGEPVLYAPAAGGAPFTITGVYFDAYTVVEMTGEGAPISSTAPALGVQLSQFTALGKAPPAQGDKFTIVRTGETFAVQDQRPDGVGGFHLVANYVSGP